MSWAALAAKSKDIPVPTTKHQIVRSTGEYSSNIIRENDAQEAPTATPETHVDPEVPVAEATEEATETENHPSRRILVLDTGALIKGSAGLPEKADDFTTIQDVITEVRDKKTREFVEGFPFEISVKEPTREAMREVIRVSKITGDFGTLSATDLRVLGLALTMAKLKNSVIPPPASALTTSTSKKKPKVNMTGKMKPKQSGGGANLPGWGSWDDKDEDEDEEEEEAEEEEKDDSVMRVEEGAEEVIENEAPGVEKVEEEGGWITQNNIKQYNADAYTKFNEDVDGRTVGCMTTDFAMQNVLLHLGVLVVSVEGYRVKHLKKWVLRCHACYCLVKDTTRQFCPDCGSGNTLKRVSYTVNDQGEEEIWINANHKIGVRGTVYNLPKPRGGRNGTNNVVVIREDQLLRCGKKTGADQLKEDLVASMLSEDWMFGSNPTKKSSNHQKPTKSSYSNKNPNQGRRRKL